MSEQLGIEPLSQLDFCVERKVLDTCLRLIVFTCSATTNKDIALLCKKRAIPSILTWSCNILLLVVTDQSFNLITEVLQQPSNPFWNS